MPKILSGEELWVQFLSEPTGGSDLAGLVTRADRDGDVWILNGSKIWSTGAHYCVGANLARMTIDLMFNAIADHLPDLKPVSAPERLRSSFINGDVIRNPSFAKASDYFLDLINFAFYKSHC